MSSVSVSIAGYRPVSVSLETGDDPLTDYYEVLSFYPRHDWKTLPDTTPLHNSQPMKLTRDIQWVLFNLCVVACFGDTNWRRHLDTAVRRRQFVGNFIQYYGSTRWTCNGGGLDTGRCYVEEEILGAAARADVARQIPIVTSTNRVREVHTGPALAGHIQIAVWDGAGMPTDPCILHHATQVSPDGVVSQLPQFQDFSPRYVPYVVPFSIDPDTEQVMPQYIASNRVRRLRQSEI